MAETIDKVQVEIEATAKGTSAVFRQLESQLGSLQRVLNSLDTSKLKQASSAAKAISVNTSGMTKAEKDISGSVDKIKQALKGLEAYKTAGLAGDNSSLVSANRQIIKLQSSLDVLDEKLRQVGDTQVSSEQFAEVEEKIEAAKDKLEGLLELEKSASTSSTPMNNEDFLQLQSNIGAAEEELRSLQAEQKNLEATDPFYKYRESSAILREEVTNAASEVKGAINQMNSTPVDVDTSDTPSKLEGIREKAEEAATSILKMVGSGIKKGFKGLKSSLSGIKNVLSGIGKTSGFASSGFGKILKYGFGIRSLYVLFRRLREAVKDSFTELQNSGADYETTRANIEALKNSLTTLKYQFGAAFEPIFNSVAPALQTLINYLVAAMNTLSAFIAKITGKSTYSKAVVATGDIASNTGSAADSAKELNKQLAGFDELNNLTSSSGGSGGGGSGGSSDASAVTYESASVDSALSSFWSSLADDVKNGEWEKVGSAISEKLSEAMESIPWDTIFSKAKNFGTNLASFLNGLINERLFSNLGTTIGNSIKTALNFLNSFGEEFEWDEFGDSIAAGINSFIQTNPLDLAVTTFNTWANGILDTLNSAVEGVSWKTLGQHIADGIGKVDAFNIAWKLGKLVTNLVNALYDIVSNKNTWTNLGQKIADGINGFFAGFDGAKLAKTCNAIINGLITTLSTIITQTSWSSIADDIVQVIGNLDIGTIALVIGGFTLAKMALDAAIVAVKGVLTTSIATGIGGLTVSGLTAAVAVVAAISLGWKWGTQIYEWATGEEVNQGMAEEIKDIFTGFTVDGVDFDLTDFITFTFGSDTYWNNFWGDIGEDIYDGVQSIKSKLQEVGNAIIEGIKTGIVDKIKSIGSWISEKFQEFVDKVKDFFGIKSPSKVFEEIGGYLIDGLKNGLTNSIKNIGTKVTEIFNTIKSKFEEKFKNFSITSFIGNVGSTVIDIATNIKTSFTGAITSFADFTGLSDKWNAFKTAFTNVASDVKAKLSGVLNKITDIDTLKSKWNNLKNAWKDISANAKAKVAEQLSKITDLDTWKEKYNNLKETWQNIASTASAKVGDQLSKITDLDTWKQKYKNLGNAWKDIKTTVKAKVGDQLKTIADVDTWRTKYESLKTQWVTVASQVKAKVGDQLSKITDLDTWKQKYNDLKGAWVDKASELKSKVGDQLSKITDLDTWKTKMNNLREKWADKAATMKAKVGDQLSKIGDVDDWKTKITNLVGAWKSPSEASFKSTFNNTLSTVESWTTKITSLYDSWKGKAAEYSVTFSAAADDLKNWIDSNVFSKIRTVFRKVPILKNYADNIAFAEGGIVDKATNALIGEAGTEAVVPLENNLGWLRKMSNMLLDGMSDASKYRFNAVPSSLAYASYGSASISDSESLLMRQNELIAEQNRLLGIIADKDVTISSRDVFNATRSESNNYFNRTGNSPFLF